MSNANKRMSLDDFLESKGKVVDTFQEDDEEDTYLPREITTNKESLDITLVDDDEIEGMYTIQFRPGGYTPEPVKTLNFRNEKSLQKYIDKDKAKLYALGYLNTYFEYDNLDELEVLEKVSKEYQFIKTHELYYIGIPVSMLKNATLIVHVDERLDYTVKHLIGKNGKNIEYLIRCIKATNDLLEYGDFIPGTKWIKEAKKELIINTNRINVVIDKR